MARVNPVPENERAICRRFRQFRLALKLTGVAFAKELGIDSNRLATYEHGRVPLRFGIVEKAIRSFSLNPQWLAEDVGEVFHYLDIDEEVTNNVDSSALFSEVWDRSIKSLWEEHKSFYDDLLRPGSSPNEIRAFRERLGRPSVGTRRLKSPLLVAAFILSAELRLLPPSLHEEWVAEIQTWAAKFRFAHQQEIESYLGPEALGSASAVEAHKKLLVDNPQSTDSFASVRTLLKKSPQNWSELQALLIKATQEPGAKARLAERFNTTRQAVHKWLSGAGAPSADLALRLAAWATEPEQAIQQKGSSTARTAKEPAAQQERSNETKSRSGQGKS